MSEIRTGIRAVSVVMDELTGGRPTDHEDASIRGQSEDCAQRRESGADNDFVENHRRTAVCVAVPALRPAAAQGTNQKQVREGVSLLTLRKNRAPLPIFWNVSVT